MKAEATNLRKNALLVGAANLLARITGLLREVAFAAAFGAGIAADSYYAAFRLGSLFRELFAEGALSSAFIPLYADIEEKEGAESAFALANAFLGVLLIAVGLVTALTFVFAEPLVYLIASGFSEVPGKVALTATMTRILAPFVAMISMASVFMGILNVRGRFFLPAAAPVVFNALTIAACLGADWFGRVTGLEPVLGMAFASLAGGASQALIQLPSLRRTGWRFRPTLGKHPALRRLLRFVAPALVAISVTQVNLLIETQLASREGDGPVSWLLYSFRLVHLPMSIVSGAVAVSALAGLSVLAAREDWAGFRRTLIRAMNLNAFLLIPAAVGLYLLAEPLVALMFERGAFTRADTLATAGMLRMYALALLGIGIHRVIVPVYYTLNDPVTPMWVGLGMVLLKLPVALALMYPLGLGVDGLPLSHGILVTLEIGLLLLLLRGRVPGMLGTLARDHIKVGVAAAIMGGAIWAFRGWAGGGGLSGAAGLFGLIALGALIFFAASAVLGLREGRELADRLLRRRPPGLPPTVDPETQRTLGQLTGQPQGEPELSGGVLRIACADRVVVIRASGGVLEARSEPLDSPAGSLSPRDVAAVMRVGAGPPRLSGLVIGQRHFRASGERIEAGETPGPVIPVPPVPGGEGAP